MVLVRAGVSLAAAAGLLAAILAVATAWLMLADPVGVADALATGTVAPIAGLLTDAVLDALRGLLKYL